MRFLDKHPQPWTVGNIFDELLDANGRSIESATLLDYVQELQFQRHMQAQMIQGFQARVKELESRDSRCTCRELTDDDIPF